MKLHLPKVLTVALLAALVSFTQASGTELKDAALTLADFSQTSLDAASGWSFTNITPTVDNTYISVSGKQAQITHNGDWATRPQDNRVQWSAIVQLDASTLPSTGSGIILQQYNLGGVGYSGGKETGAWQGNVRDWTVDKALATCVDGDGMLTLGVVTLGEGGTRVFLVDGQKNTYAKTEGGLKGNYYNANPSMILTATAGVEYESLYLFGSAVSDDDMFAMMQSLVTVVESKEYTWSATGSSAAWDTTTQNWTKSGAASAYLSDPASVAIFNEGEYAKEVLVGAGIKAGEVQVKDSYTFSVGEGDTLNISSLSVATGKTLTVSGEGTVRAEGVTNNGTINIEEGSRLSLGDVKADNKDIGTIATGAGMLAIDKLTVTGGNGKVTLENPTEIGTVQLTGGVVNYGGEAGHQVENLRLSQDGTQVSTVNVEAGATLHITGTEIGTTGGTGSFLLSHWNAANVLNINGTLISEAIISSWDGTATINVEEGGTLELRAGLNRNGERSKAIYMTIKDGATLVTGTAVGGADNDSLHVTLADGATLKGYYRGEAVEATIARAMTLGAVTVDAGDSGYTLTLSGALTANGTIGKIGDGTLVLAGAVDISGNSGSLTRKLVGGETEGNVNGFAAESGTITVYTGENVTIGEDACITYKGQDVTDEMEDGVYTLADVVDYSTFQLNVGTEKVSTAKKHEELRSIMVAGDTTLVVDDDYTSANIVVWQDIANVNIVSGKTLSGTLNGVIMSGGGTYALDAGTTSLGMGVTLDEQDWTGTVALSNVEIVNINLNDYGYADSKVAMDGVRGYFLQSDTTVFAPELVLEGDGLTLTDGFSTLASGTPKPPTKYTFAGGVSGEGDMTFSHKYGTASNVTQHLYFTGDVYDWTGSLNVVAGFTVYAQFSGEDKTVGATIKRTGGTLNVEVGTGEDASDVTFAESITSDRLDVLAGATATLLGDLTASTITVAEGASLFMENGTLSSAITSAGTVTLTSVTLSDAFEEVPGGEVKYDIADTQNYYMGTSNSYITVVTGDGIADATGSDLTWKDKEGLEMADGQVITSAGSINYGTLYIGGGETTTEQIAGYEHHDLLQNIVVETGTLTVNQPLTGIGIEVSEHGTIAGNVTPTEVGIAAGATAEFTADVAGTGFKFSAAEEGTVTVINGGETTTTYTAGDRNMTVKADTLAAETFWEEVAIGNKVQVDNVTAADYSILTLDNVAEGPLELQNLTIGTMAYVQVYASDNHVSDNEATVVISDTLTAGTMSTLNADLTMKAGSTLALVGTSDMALTLGSTLTFDTADGLVNLGEDVIAYLSAMNVGDSVAFFTHGVGTTLDYGGEYDGMYYDGLFVRPEALVGDFKVYADGTSFGLTKYYRTPEPTTGTLSLLALAALAARRRRK